MNKARLGIGFAAVAAALATAGCMADGKAASGPGGSSAAAAGEPSASASSPAATAPSAGTPAPVPLRRNAQRCHTSGLAGHVEGHGAGAGQRYAFLGLTNKTSTACTIYGYPGLQLVDAHGSARPTTVRRDTAVAPRLLVVKPGQTVWARLHWTVVPADDEVADHCAPDPASLRVIPPDETAQLTVAFRYGAVCQHGEIAVDPFAANRPVSG